uniref:Autophagy protein ATG5 UblA domain-containing protein n=1 Tax=Neobodo designis TaxID=312471 RepID=A0A7S1WA53_NEODS|mmetsp:Transcript_8588/g.26736  ORF Transcript_8588/g.26736 Transcript_8588/m.26736 type:complete len:452 (+) Transcript_8588:79-1434(+)
MPAGDSDDAVRSIELLRASTVPVQVSLCPADVTAKKQPTPCYFNVPRRSLLAALWAPLSAAFSEYIADFGTPPPMWILTEADEALLARGEKVQPVPWHSPVGALVDSVCGRMPTRPMDPATDNTSFINLALPLRLVAHMAPPPPKTVAWRLHRAKDAEILAQQGLKQGLMARFGGLRAFYKAAPEHIAAFVAGNLRSQVGTAADHGKYREAAEAILKVGRTVCVHDGDTPRLPIAVHRGGKRCTVTVETPITSAAQDAIKAQKAPASPLPAQAGGASSQPPGSEGKEGSAEAPGSPAEPPVAATTTAAAPSEDGVPSTPKRDDSNATAGTATAEPETPYHMQHGSPDGLEEPASPGPAPPDTGAAHADTLLLARAVAAALTPEELAEPGCNLSNVDAPPAEPFCHPRLMVLVAGLRPLLTMPLSWAMQHLTYADLALHVVVIDTTERASGV